MMRKLWRVLAVALLFMALTGCHAVHYEHPITPSGKKELRQHFFALGMVGASQVVLEEECPQGVARFSDTFTPLDVLFAVVSVGIYTPRTVVMECAA